MTRRAGYWPSRQQPQSPGPAQPRLWLRTARRGGGAVEGQAYRQRAKDHSHRAIQGPQGPQRHALAGDTRPVAANKMSNQERNVCGVTPFLMPAASAAHGTGYPAERYQKATMSIRPCRGHAFAELDDNQ
jgi:hypothetical protein